FPPPSASCSPSSTPRRHQSVRSNGTSGWQQATLNSRNLRGLASFSRLPSMTSASVCASQPAVIFSDHERSNGTDGVIAPGLRRPPPGDGGRRLPVTRRDSARRAFENHPAIRHLRENRSVHDNCSPNILQRRGSLVT